MSPFLLDPAHQAVVDGKSRRIKKTVPLVGLLMLVPFVGGGGFVGWHTAHEFANERSLNAHGRAVEGRIVSKRSHEDDGTDYYLTYEFRPGDRSIRREQQVERDDYARTPRDAPVTVEYLPEDPETSRLVGFENLNLGTVGILFQALWVILSVGVAITLIRTHLRERRIQAYGEIVPGRVTSASGEDDEGHYKVTIRYEFTDRAGRTGHGRRTSVREDLRQLALPQPGDPVRVLCLDAEQHLLL